jgi:hypothetical protein
MSLPLARVRRAACFASMSAALAWSAAAQFRNATIVCHSNCRIDKLDLCLPDWVFQKIEAAGSACSRDCARGPAVAYHHGGAALPVATTAI